MNNNNPLCRAALNIKGEHFPCDWPTDPTGRHDGWAHANNTAQAIWQSHDEDSSPPKPGMLRREQEDL